MSVKPKPRNEQERRLLDEARALLASVENKITRDHAELDGLEAERRQVDYDRTYGQGVDGYHQRKFLDGIHWPKRRHLNE